jgi:hypothetical protein
MSAYMEDRVNVLKRLASEAEDAGRMGDRDQLVESAVALKTMIEALDRCSARLSAQKGAK